MGAFTILLGVSWNDTTGEGWSLDLHCSFYFHLKHRSWSGNKIHHDRVSSGSHAHAACNSPANLAWIDSWNRLSSHIVHTTDVTGNGFTGDGWTANTRTRRDWSSLLFTVRTDGTGCYLQESSDNAPVVTPALKVAQGLRCYWTTCMGTLTVQFLLPLSVQELKWEWEICIYCTSIISKPTSAKVGLITILHSARPCDFLSWMLDSQSQCR